MVQVPLIKTDAEFEDLKKRLWTFMKEDIYPNEKTFNHQNHEIGLNGNEWTHSPILIELMTRAKQKGLWNMFLPIDSAEAAGNCADGMSHGLTNRQYAEICEILVNVNIYAAWQWIGYCPSDLVYLQCLFAGVSL